MKAPEGWKIKYVKPGVILVTTPHDGSVIATSEAERIPEIVFYELCVAILASENA